MALPTPLTRKEIMGREIVTKLSPRQNIFNDIHAERNYQDEKWGKKFDNKNTANDWIAYLTKETGHAVQYVKPFDKHAFRKALVKVASTAVAAIETLERNDGMPDRHYD